MFRRDRENIITGARYGYRTTPTDAERGGRDTRDGRGRVPIEIYLLVNPGQQRLALASRRC